MDAMSDAIEGAAVMLYGVSLKYKESANVRFVLLPIWYLPCMLSLPCMYTKCRLEANYAHQQKLDMIPLMMQEAYTPQGWRKPQHQVFRLLVLPG